jgi:hypothetical protein
MLDQSDMNKVALCVLRQATRNAQYRMQQAGQETICQTVKLRTGSNSGRSVSVDLWSSPDGEVSYNDFRKANVSACALGGCVELPACLAHGWLICLHSHSSPDPRHPR